METEYAVRVHWQGKSKTQHEYTDDGLGSLEEATRHLAYVKNTKRWAPGARLISAVIISREVSAWTEVKA